MLRPPGHDFASQGLNSNAHFHARLELHYRDGKKETAATAVRALADANASSDAHVAVVAISASERQKPEREISTFTQFQERLAALDLTHLDILRPMLYWDVTFWNWCVWPDDEAASIERQLHQILFPSVEFLWQDYCRAHGLDRAAPVAGKWRNCKCDVQHIWTHVHKKRDVFVTSNEKFHALSKKTALIALGVNRIEHPDGAVSLL
jgi:hypothetical protein